MEDAAILGSIVLVIMTVFIWKGVAALQSIAKSMRTLVEQKEKLEDKNGG